MPSKTQGINVECDKVGNMLADFKINDKSVKLNRKRLRKNGRPFFPVVIPELVQNTSTAPPVAHVPRVPSPAPRVESQHINHNDMARVIQQYHSSTVRLDAEPVLLRTDTVKTDAVQPATTNGVQKKRMLTLKELCTQTE